MFYLLLSVLSTSFVFLILKEFQRYRLDNLQAIVASYFTALTIGVCYGKSTFSISFVLSQNWVWGAMTISSLFIIVFNLMAVTAQKGGLSVMTVANKMSVVIPISFGIIWYEEDLGLFKVLGILLALLAVWFTAKKKGVERFDQHFWYLPFFIFIGSGLADAIINHMQHQFVPSSDFDVFSTSLFLFCGFLGIIVLFIKGISGAVSLSFKNIVGGLVLGVPNYFSIYYLLKALAQPQYESSLIFSVNNLLVVLVSVALGFFVYREKLNRYNFIGLSFSLLAILIFYFTL